MKEMKRLTVKEEEIMRMFWENGPMFVRELLAYYDEPKPHYNTVSTLVRGLEEKGFVGYKPYGNTYQYYTLISEKEYKSSALKDVISQYYNNSYVNVVSSFIEEEGMSVDELKALIDSIERGRTNK
ncbi:BlaI/MecI/CopY family transcriptional regulator [Bacteroides faecichinchillae]|nr:BlaI/MecI/CopY family transcriptional regulator [Bacteroides faecichinchillae]